MQFLVLLSHLSIRAMSAASDRLEGLMILSPTKRWGDWVEAAGAEENMVTYTFVRDVLCSNYEKKVLQYLFGSPWYEPLKLV